MNTDELITRIRSKGYWRVNFRPCSADDEIASVSKARRIVEQSTVSLRGWDFPHMPGTGQDYRTANMANSFQAWTDWADKHEFWGIYTSSQFIHLKGIRTDWVDEDTFHDQRTPRYPPNVLGLMDNVWHVTESFEFLSRLTEAGLYKRGAEVSIGLINTAGRTLHVDDVKRGGLHWDRTTQAFDIKFQKEFSNFELTEPKIRTIEAMRYILDRFNFEPEDDVLKGIIDELYGLNIGRG